MANTGVELRDVQAGTISIHGVTVGPTPEELVIAMEARGLLAGAELAGLQRRTIIMLAQRLKPAERLDFEQAVTELERAVEVALDVIAKGERGTNDDAFVNTVLARVAERVRSDDLDGGAQAIDAALAEIDAQYRRSQTTLLEEGVKVDTLRRDAAAVARRIERLVAVDHPTGRPAWLPEFRARLDGFFADGETSGARFSLSVAAEMARLMLAAARSPDERGTARFRQGVALLRLGERESGNERLAEAVTVFRAALKEYPRKRAPLDWARIQNDLANALRRLGEREKGTERLEEAVAAYREALKEQTRARAPLNWATGQNNLGNALRRLGERESGTARLEEAVAAFREALKVRTRARVSRAWAETQNNLGNALRELGEREKDGDRLEQAVTAYRKALKELTRERVPLEWAMAQSNLGTALSTLGEREGSPERLREAIATYREVLREYTRERVPLYWAGIHANLGTALSRLGEHEGSAAILREAVAAFREALKEYTRDRVPLEWAVAQNNLGNTLERLGECESSSEPLEEAVAVFDAALEVLVAAKFDHYLRLVGQNRARVASLLEQRRKEPA